jgi:hypothetical protein
MFRGAAFWSHDQASPLPAAFMQKTPRRVRARGSRTDLGRANRAAVIGGWVTANGELKAERRGWGANAERLA